MDELFDALLDAICDFFGIEKRRGQEPGIFRWILRVIWKLFFAVVQFHCFASIRLSNSSKVETPTSLVTVDLAFDRNRCRRIGRMVFPFINKEGAFARERSSFFLLEYDADQTTAAFIDDPLQCLGELGAGLVGHMLQLGM